MLAEAQRVEAIPTKRVQPSRTIYLERDEIDALFRTFPTDGNMALRDRALLMFLYNTGARVQEAADLRNADIDVDEPYKVRLHGKGDKWRCCPLWPETAALLKRLMTCNPTEKTSPVFLSQQRKPLTRFGIYKIVKRHTAVLDAAHLDRSTMVCTHTPFDIAPRFTCLKQALRSMSSGRGSDMSASTRPIAMPRSRCGRSRPAVAACLPPVDSSAECRPAAGWRQNQDLMTWLESL